MAVLVIGFEMFLNDGAVFRGCRVEHSHALLATRKITDRVVRVLKKEYLPVIINYPSMVAFNYIFFLQRANEIKTE